MIRLATEDDKQDILRMAEKFCQESGYSEVIDYDPETTADLFSSALDQNMCFVACQEGSVVGFVLGLVFPSIVNKHVYSASELAWWVDPEHRKSSVGIKLLQAIEKAAKDNGAKMWSMMCLESLNPDQVEKMYLKMGYKRTERTFTKVFER